VGTAESSESDDLRKELIEISRRCGAKGWCPGASGNISALDFHSGRVYLKASGADMSRLEMGDILTLDLEGNILNGEGRPSEEVNIHLSVYKVRRDVRAVLHVHPQFATAYAAAGERIPLVTDVARIVLRDVPLLEYAPPGSLELAERVVEGFNDEKVKAVLLREHGIVSVGGSLLEAYHMAELVEDAAKVAFLRSIIRGFKKEE